MEREFQFWLRLAREYRDEETVLRDLRSPICPEIVEHKFLKIMVYLGELDSEEVNETILANTGLLVRCFTSHYKPWIDSVKAVEASFLERLREDPEWTYRTPDEEYRAYERFQRQGSSNLMICGWMATRGILEAFDFPSRMGVEDCFN